MKKKIYNYHEKKKIGTEPGWATAQVSLRLGWALGAGRAGAGRAGTAQVAWTRRGARQAQAGARGATGWAACARLVCAAGPGWVFCCT